MGFATAAGAIAGAAISAGGAMSTNSASAAYNKKTYQKRYQWTVKDLMAAGLNPMLAYTQGAPVPHQVQFENPAAGAGPASAKVADVMIAKRQLDIQDATAKSVQANNYAQADQAAAQAQATRNATLDPGITSEEARSRTALNYQRITESGIHIEKLGAEIQNLRSTNDILQREYDKLKAEIGYIEQQTKHSASGTRLMDLDYETKSRLQESLVRISQLEASIKEREERIKGSEEKIKSADADEADAKGQWWRNRPEGAYPMMHGPHGVGVGLGVTDILDKMTQGPWRFVPEWDGTNSKK